MISAYSGRGGSFVNAQLLYGTRIIALNLIDAKLQKLFQPLFQTTMSHHVHTAARKSFIASTICCVINDWCKRCFSSRATTKFVCCFDAGINTEHKAGIQLH